MGYYTTFHLYVLKDNLLTQDFSFIEDLDDLNIDGQLYWQIKTPDACEDAKWYNHDSDMVEFSKMYPARTFVLFGEGESHDDQWCSIYHNGNFVTANSRTVYETVTMDGTAINPNEFTYGN